MSDGESPSDLAALVGELLLLLEESEAYHAHPDLKDVLSEARKAVAGFYRRLAAAGRRYVVAVVGLSNVGKSTLLGALLGGDVAPRRNGPCTAVPVEFVHGESPRVSVVHRHSARRPSWPCAGLAEIRSRLDRLADDAGAEAGLSVQKVVVALDHPLLREGLVIADTPGFGAGQGGEAAGSHEEALKQYLAGEVSQVLWVVLAEQGIGRREMEFHDRAFGEVCDDVLVTGSEGWAAEDRERFRRRYARHFGARLPRFHFVSGLGGLEARRAGDLRALERANIPLVEERVGRLAAPAGRHAAVRAALLSLAEDLRSWLGEFRDGRGRPLKSWWRPDSWSRWDERAPAGALKNQLAVLLGGR